MKVLVELNDNEDREAEKKASTAGDNTSQSVCTNSESNSDSVPAPEPQSPPPPSPPKLSHKLPGIVVKAVVRDDSARPATQKRAIDVTARNDSSDTNAKVLAVGVANDGRQTHPCPPTSRAIAPKPAFARKPKPLRPGSHPSAPINYLDVELNATDFATTATSPHMPYTTHTVCVATVWVMGMKFPEAERRPVVELIQILKANAGANYREVVPQLMAKSGFDGWHYDKCLNYFHNAFDLYKKTLANCPNRETAATVYPLFDTMHSFVPYFLVNVKDLMKLKRLFAQKCGDKLTTGADTRLPTATTAPGVRGKVPKTSAKTHSNSAQHQPIGATKTMVNPELQALYQVCTGITDTDVTTFTQLCRCVGETVDTLGSFVDNRKQFWPHVNRLMAECGYPLPKQNTYRKLFTAHVCTYYKI
ncbi:unnamed protein product, partial [Medioppia subpectinata]